MNRRTAVVLLVLSALISAAQGEAFNGTTYILTGSEAEVVQAVKGCSFNLTLHTKSNITLISDSGDQVPFNSTVNFWRGSYKYRIITEEPVGGHLNYTQPLFDQRLVVSMMPNESFRVVLPSGYSTGDSLLGRAWPTPDERYQTDGRMILTWRGATKRRVVNVNYYKEKAPREFQFFLLFLLFVGGLVALEYLIHMKRLRSVQEEEKEEDDPDREERHV
ncbi:MAG: hypothetical protein D4Q77_01770 [Methanothrix sp.]|nr:MAG: hypothetical protein D4Q77_01770 [Methanothrix sp.]